LFANQIAAFFIGLGAVLTLWLLNNVSQYVTGVWKTIVDALDLIAHFLSFYRGIIDLKDVVYFISMTFLFLFIGSALIEMRRWR